MLAACAAVTGCLPQALPEALPPTRNHSGEAASGSRRWAFSANFLALKQAMQHAATLARVAFKHIVETIMESNASAREKEAHGLQLPVVAEEEATAGAGAVVAAGAAAAAGARDLEQATEELRQALICHPSLLRVTSLLRAHPGVALVPTKQGMLALHHAVVECEDTEVVLAILEAAPEAAGRKTEAMELPIHFIQPHTSAAVIKALMKAAPETVSAVNFWGSPLLHWAVEANRSLLALYLLRHHPESCCLVNAKGQSPLQVAMKKAEHLSFLSEHGAEGYEEDWAAYRQVLAYFLVCDPRPWAAVQADLKAALA